MAWWNIFNRTKTVDSITDSVINTGDKLFYTDEEKAEMKADYVKSLPTIMRAFEPFKLAQRYLALFFSFLFGITFLTGLFMTVSNINTKREALQKGITLENIVYYDIEPLFNLVGAFSLGIIMLAIVSFYFGGGVIDSIKRGK